MLEVICNPFIKQQSSEEMCQERTVGRIDQWMVVSVAPQMLAGQSAGLQTYLLSFLLLRWLFVLSVDHHLSHKHRAASPLASLLVY